jgi:hypothetical protein
MIEFVGKIEEDDLYKIDQKIISWLKSRELVRCKNCRYYDPRNLWCFKFLEYMTGDDFCSKGTILE